MTPDWQSDTVIALTNGIVADVAYDRLPILADALEEAGCDDVVLLDRCRDVTDTTLHGPWLTRVIAGLITAAQAAASKDWMTRKAHEVVSENDEYDHDHQGEHGNFAWLMAICRQYRETGDGVQVAWETQNRWDVWAGELWQHYEVLTGQPPLPPERDLRNRPQVVTPFRCPC